MELASIIMKNEEKTLFQERLEWLSSCDASLRQGIICLSAFYRNSATPIERAAVRSALVCLGYPMKLTNSK